MKEYKAGGFPNLTYVDKEQTVADVNKEITSLKALLRRALVELTLQEKYLPDEYYEDEEDNIDSTLAKDILNVFVQ